MHTSDETIYDLAVTVVEKLSAANKTISFAESCTGGLVAAKLVDVPSASSVFNASVVTYANEAKVDYLGVLESTIEEFGVVSEPVAGQMAAGVAKRNHAQVGVGVSGIAGPTGGSSEKPVGMVCFGFYFDGDIWTATQYFGDIGRNEVRRKSVEFVYRVLAEKLYEQGDAITGKFEKCSEGKRGSMKMFNGKEYVEKQSHDYTELREIISILRSPEGCPWDREQTPESLKKCLTDEVDEVLQAIDNRDPENLCEELGDVLLQLLLIAEIAKEREWFSFDDVIQGISDKMIRRHPHVFGELEGIQTADDTLDLWKKVKDQEKKDRQ